MLVIFVVKKEKDMIKAVVRICNGDGSKYTGFEIGTIDVAQKIIRKDFGVTTKFKIGDRELEIVEITIDGFYPEFFRENPPVIDSENIYCNCVIWLHCNCDDEEFLSQGYDHSQTTLEEISQNE